MIINTNFRMLHLYKQLRAYLANKLDGWSYKPFIQLFSLISLANPLYSMIGLANQHDMLLNYQYSPNRLERRKKEKKKKETAKMLTTVQRYYMLSQKNYKLLRRCTKCFTQRTFNVVIERRRDLRYSTCSMYDCWYWLSWQNASMKITMI